MSTNLLFNPLLSSAVDGGERDRKQHPSQIRYQFFWEEEENGLGAALLLLLRLSLLIALAQAESR